MSELTEIVRGGFDSDGCYLGDVEYILKLCDEHERLEADLDMMGDYVDLLQREHEVLEAECKRLRLRLEIAYCASDHAVMFANGEHKCGCGREEPS